MEVHNGNDDDDDDDDHDHDHDHDDHDDHDDHEDHEDHDDGDDGDDGDDHHHDWHQDSYDDGGNVVMAMVTVKADGGGGCGDDSGCFAEGVAWRITKSNITMSRT